MPSPALLREGARDLQCVPTGNSPNWSPGTLAGLLGKAEQNAAIIRRSGIAIAPRLAI